MAWQVQMTQTVSMCCDRCGRRQDEWYMTYAEAIEAAKSSGDFVDAGYESGGAKLQAWLCCDCHGEQPDEVVEGKS